MQQTTQTALEKTLEKPQFLYYTPGFRSKAVMKWSIFHLIVLAFCCLGTELAGMSPLTTFSLSKGVMIKAPTLTWSLFLPLKPVSNHPCISLTLYLHPCLFQDARNQYERIGRNVTMQCGILENNASVSWKVNGTDVKAQHHLEGPRLILTKVNLSHNGLYTCFLNPFGERVDTIYLHIGRK